MKKYKTAIILFSAFEIIAISLWLATGSLFYLLNFSYIGTVIGVGLALSKVGWKYATECILCHKCTKECPVKALK